MKIPAAFAILIFCNVLSLHGESAPTEGNQAVSVTVAQSGNVVNQTTHDTVAQNATGIVGPAGPSTSNAVPKDNSLITANTSKDNGSSVENPTTIVAENETTTITPHAVNDNNTTTEKPTDKPTTKPTTPSTPPTEPTKPTTPSPPTTKPTTPSPPTTKPTTPSPAPNTTTTEAPKPEPTTQIPVVPTTPAPVAPTTPAPHRNRFDGPSFIGGIVLSLGLVAIGFIGWKYYKTTILTCFIRSPLRNVFNFNS